MRPIRPTAEEVFSDAAILVFVLAMFVICSTMENDDICCIESLVSIGELGSWCCSWATNSFRKPSLSNAAEGLDAEVEPDCAPALVVSGSVFPEMGSTAMKGGVQLEG